MSEKHRDYFNSKAVVWDKMMAHKPHEKLREILGPLDIGTGSTVLDVGSGTGVLLPLLKEITGPSGKIVAFDLAEEMLAVSKEKNGEAQIDYVQGDIANTPFAAQSFDAVICNSCFPHFPDKQAAAAEIARILKPGGLVVICHLSSRNELNDMHQSLGGVVGKDVLPDEETMMLIFKTAGFSCISIEDLTDRYVLTARMDK